MSVEAPPPRGDVAGQVDWLVRAIGTENDDGDGGQGLTGRVARLETKFTRLDLFVNRVLGGLAVLGFAASMVLLFFKTLVSALVNGAHHP